MIELIELLRTRGRVADGLREAERELELLELGIKARHAVEASEIEPRVAKLQRLARTADAAVAAESTLHKKLVRRDLQDGHVLVLDPSLHSSMSKLPKSLTKTIANHDRHAAAIETVF